MFYEYHIREIKGFLIHWLEYFMKFLFIYILFYFFAEPDVYSDGFFNDYYKYDEVLYGQMYCKSTCQDSDDSIISDGSVCNGNQRSFDDSSTRRSVKRTHHSKFPFLVKYW